MATILLPVTLFSAENARHFVAICVVARVVVPPLLLILVVSVVVLRSEILMALLTPVLLSLGIELLLTILCDSLNIVFFFFLLDSLDPGCAPGLILGAKFDRGQTNCGVQIQGVHGLQVDDPPEVWW
jgi:hypothetical protein